MFTKLDQIMEKAKSNPKLRFTSLAHLLTPEFLTETWKQMNRRGASLDTRVHQLCERLKRFGKFGLELAEEKTRVMRFGRFVRGGMEKTGNKPDTFDFLGF
jgi:hypothetical protein